MKLKIILFLVFISSILIFYSKISDNLISEIYSQKIFLFINFPIRLIINLFPFSVGDILYILIVILLFSLIINQIKKGINGIIPTILQLLFYSGMFIFIFITLWGWNYKRKNLYKELNLEKRTYDKSNLEKAALFFLEKVNTYKELSKNDSIKSKKQIINSLKQPIAKIKSELSFLKSTNEKIKPSLFSDLISFMGVTGYYNPFTSEAQINKNIPIFTYPFVACHEISHQMGIASEDEANFIGFLICLKSDDNFIKYSAYFEIYLYIIKELKKHDRLKAEKIIENLSPLVKKDIIELQNYYQKHKSILDDISSIFYDKYLKINHQKEGIKSYNNVVNLIIEYYNF